MTYRGFQCPHHFPGHQLDLAAGLAVGAGHRHPLQQPLREEESVTPGLGQEAAATRGAEGDTGPARGADEVALGTTCHESHYRHTRHIIVTLSHLVTLPDGRLPRHGQTHRTLEVLLELLEGGDRGGPRHRVVTGHDGGCRCGDDDNNASVL